MHVKAQLQSYEKLAFSITLTAPVEDWRGARKQLERMRTSGYIEWPLSKLVDAIDKMLLDLDKTHYAAITREAPDSPRQPLGGSTS